MIEERTVGERGQVVIPKRLRERFGLKPGKKVLFEAKENAVILRPEKDPEKFVEEFISVPRKLKSVSMEKIKRILQDEYEIR